MRRLRQGCSGRTAAWLLFLLAALPAPALGVVDEADEVCPPGADPCVISQPIQIADGADLDFGVRALRIAPGGRLEIGPGSVALRCGGFEAATAGAVAVLARGKVAEGGQDGGELFIESRGTCQGNRFVGCLLDSGCDKSPCIDGVCAGAPQALCLDDSDCELGSCRPGAGVSLVGSVEAQGGIAGSLTVLSAGDVALNDVIDLDSTAAEGDGGLLEVTSSLGSVSIAGRVEATSGRLGLGGLVAVSAAEDIAVTGILDASGGDFDGGEVELFAGRDVSVSGALRSDSKGGEGAGGVVALSAGRDIVLRSTAVLTSDGHRSADNFGGDGGVIALSAEGDATIEAGAKAEADGAIPDGFGGEIEILAGGDVAVAGGVSAKANGGQGGGGVIDLSGCAIELESTASIVNDGEAGENLVTARESFVTRLGSKLLADRATGMNTILYRDPDDLSLQGTIDPPPALERTPELQSCQRCGNGVVDGGEDCDDGDAAFVRGDDCSAECSWVECGDPDGSGSVNASDALTLLRVAVGVESCAGCVCDVDGSTGPASASDALAVLRAAVGLPVGLACPPCALS